MSYSQAPTEYSSNTLFSRGAMDRHVGRDIARPNSRLDSSTTDLRDMGSQFGIDSDIIERANTDISSTAEDDAHRLRHELKLVYERLLEVEGSGRQLERRREPVKREYTQGDRDRRSETHGRYDGREPRGYPPAMQYDDNRDIPYSRGEYIRDDRDNRVRHDPRTHSPDRRSSPSRRYDEDHDRPYSRGPYGRDDRDNRVRHDPRSRSPDQRAPPSRRYDGGHDRSYSRGPYVWDDRDDRNGYDRDRYDRLDPLPKELPPPARQYDDDRDRAYSQGPSRGQYDRTDRDDRDRYDRRDRSSDERPRSPPAARSLPPPSYAAPFSSLEASEKKVKGDREALPAATRAAPTPIGPRPAPEDDEELEYVDHIVQVGVEKQPQEGRESEILGKQEAKPQTANEAEKTAGKQREDQQADHYDQMFRDWDVQGTGFFSRETAFVLFDQTVIDRDDLAQIWYVPVRCYSKYPY